MAITLNTDQITSSSGHLGFGASPNSSYEVDVNGTLRCTNLRGNGANLTGIVQGHQYYTQETFSGGFNNQTSIIRTISNVPAGHYIVFFNQNWYDGGDEDWGSMYVDTTAGNVRTTVPWNREEGINGGTGTGLQGYAGMADVNQTSTGSIRLRWAPKDTDGGGIFGYFGIQLWKQA